MNIAIRFSSVSFIIALAVVSAGAFFVSAPLAHAATFNVDPACPAATPGTCDDASTFTTIQAAVTAAAPGDTINVAAETYGETVTVDKSLTINGAQAGVAAADTVTGVPRSASETTVTKFAVTASDVIIDGFTLSNAGVDGQISVTGAATLSGVIIRNNIFTGYNNVGLVTLNAGNVSITGNYFTGPLPATEAIQIKDFTADNQGCTGSSITNNVFTGATNNGASDVNLSCTTSNSTGITISGNRESGNSGGTNFTAISGVTGGISITNNTVIGSTGSAIFFFGDVSGLVTIDGNTVTGGAGGVSIHGGDIIPDDEANTGTFTITNNTFTGNNLGVSVASGALAGSAVVNVNNNDLSENSTAGVNNDSGITVDATLNYWGTAVASTIASNITGSGVTTYEPYYVSSTGALDGTGTLNTTVPGTVYVSAAYTDGAADGHSFGYDATTTIQAGIDAVASGGTVNVAAGTYDEQVVIDGKDITLQGAGDTTIVRPSAPATITDFYTYPAGIFGAGAVLAPFILVENGASSTVKDFRVDGSLVTSLPIGAGRLVGVFFGISSGVIDNVTVTTIKTTGYADRTYGIELSGAASGAHTVEVKNSHVTDWGRNGIVANGASLTANIHDNTLVGPGTISGQVPNGILFISGAGGNATGNVISGMHYNASGSRTAGILAFANQSGLGALASGIVIENNDISDTDDGINLSGSDGIIVRSNNLHDNLEVGVHLEAGATNNAITNNTIATNAMAGIRLGGADDPVPANADTPPGAGNVANGNSFTGNLIGIANYDNTTFDATSNWWDDTSGPTVASNVGGAGEDITESVTDSVTYNPWYTNATKTTLSDGETTDAVYTSTIEGEADLPEGETEVELTDDTVLDLSDGLLDDAVTLNSGTPGEDVVLTNSDLPDFAASIPDGTNIQGPSGWDGKITPPIFGMPAGGAAPAGFSVGSTVISIGSPDGTLVFDQAVTILLAGVTGTVGYRPSGSDSWQAITNACAEPYATPGDPPAGSECAISNGTDTKIVTFHFTSFAGLNVAVPSGGGGGVYTTPITVSTPATSATPTTPAVTAATSATPAPQGQVLGAATYNFGANLTVGSRGADVTELQKALIAEGFLKITAPTGYFGALTKASVRAYQTAHNLPSTGFVGPLTRAVLNQGTTPATTAQQLQSLQEQLVTLQAKLKALLGL